MALEKGDVSNVTIRTSMNNKENNIVIVPTAEDLIPPYDALKIAALDFDHENDGGDTADAEMEDNITGNELMMVDDDDLLADEIENMESVGKSKQDSVLSRHEQTESESTILTIEDSKDTTKGMTEDETGQVKITRSITRSLFPTQDGNQRRASPRINAQPAQNIARGKRGTDPKKATTSVGNQKQGMVDAKHPPHRHQ